MKQSPARIFAADVHENQVSSDKPYTLHLDQVMGLLKPYSETAETNGYLHDVVARKAGL